MWAVTKFLLSDSFKIGAIIIIWTAICLFMFTPFSRYVTEKLLERSIVLADTSVPTVLTEIKEDNAFASANTRAFVYQDNSQAITSKSSTRDGRAVVMHAFLIEYNSPLAPYSDVIIAEADKHNLDWRILVSISGVESRFCKVYPAGTYNGWGWRGGPGGTWQQFDGWEHAIKHLSTRLALGYHRPDNPFEIEATYCPPCGATGQHNWARAVSMYMSKLSEMLENYKLSK